MWVGGLVGGGGLEQVIFFFYKKNPNLDLVGWLVVLGLTAL